MKNLIAMAVIVGTGLLGGCSKQSSTTTDETPMYQMTVGEKTDLYEVVAPNALQLADGVKFKVVGGPGGGKENGIVLMRPNGEIGGYVVCGCVGATTSSCRTESDNPNHPSCTGGCTDSEGNPHGCGIFGPLPGPPRDPLSIRLATR